MIATRHDYRLLATLLVSLLATGAVRAAVGPEGVVTCHASDPEVLDRMLIFQKSAIYVQRFGAGAISEPYLIGSPVMIDVGVSSTLTQNGPEPGRKSNGKFVVVYTKQDANQRWYVARAEHTCTNPNPYANACWNPVPVPDWTLIATPNTGALDNRWGPFATIDDSPNYLLYVEADIDPADLPPDPRGGSVDSKLRWRSFTGTVDVAPRDVIAQSPGRFGKLGAKTIIITAISVADENDVIGLVNVTDPPHNVTLLPDDATGIAAGPTFWFDSLGRPMLSYRWKSGEDAAENKIVIRSCLQPNPLDCFQASNWPKLMEFTYHDVEGDASTLKWVQSQEPFLARDSAGAVKSYITFISGDGDGAFNITNGNVWFAEVPQAGPPFTFVKANAPGDAERKESEVFMSSNGPVILWSQENLPNCGGGGPCDVYCGNSAQPPDMLMGAYTGLLAALAEDVNELVSTR